MSRYARADRDQHFQLPPDLRAWLPAGYLAHFVIAAMERAPLSRFEVNVRNSASEKYHPHTMLALLIYCYTSGIFSSRRIERATYRDIGMCFVAVNFHPDRDTICEFHRENLTASSEGFLQVLIG